MRGFKKGSVLVDYEIIMSDDYDRSEGAATQASLTKNLKTAVSGNSLPGLNVDTTYTPTFKGIHYPSLLFICRSIFLRGLR